jgi:hypothetical protein
MSLIGDEIGAQDKDVDEDAPSPWESIEPEDADQEQPVVAHSPAKRSTPTSTGGIREALDELFCPSIEPRDEDESETPAQELEPMVVHDPESPGVADAAPEPVREEERRTTPSPSSPSDSEESLLAPPAGGGGWTIPLLCLGIGLIACCLIIPQADANRRMAYQKELLQRDLDSIKKQLTVNEEFIKRVNDDSELAERLAQRQMNIVPVGSRVWQPGTSTDPDATSPFALTAVPKPVPLPPYQPIGGWFSAVCRDARSNLYLTGVALMMLAAGLVMGIAPGSR